jgi:GT2 family glycosyltransferase
MTHDVVICVHNAAVDAERCLTSILGTEQDIQSIIVVDDASEAETHKILRRIQESSGAVEIVRLSSRHGYTKSANVGLRHSSAEVATLLNSDTILAPGWGRKISQKFESHAEIGIVGPLSNAASFQSVPSIEGGPEQTAINAVPKNVTVWDIDTYCERLSRSLTVPYVPLVHGFCYSIRNEVIRRIGLFDEKGFPLGYGEENDYCFRAADAGFALAVAIDTYVFHAKSKSFAADERIPLMKNGMETLVEKHSKRRIANAVRFMKMNPILQRMRDGVRGQFYSESPEPMDGDLKTAGNHQ